MFRVAGSLFGGGRRRGRALIAAACLAACLRPQPAQAAADPVNARGYDVSQVYHGYAELDSVNSFNGNLMLSIPLGQTFKTNGTLSYAFKLQYNSNLWDMRQWERVGTDDIPKQSEWTRPTGTTEAYESPEFNAGLGWRLSVSGTLKHNVFPVNPHNTIVPEDYIDGSGAAHRLESRELHSNAYFDASATGLGYSHDGSYLRRSMQSGYVLVEHPDGIKERFVCLSDCGTAKAWWELDLISDPFGDVLAVTRTPFPQNDGGDWTWTFTESVTSAQGVTTAVRSHTAHFTKDSHYVGGYRLTSLSIASPDSAQATYSFNYTPMTIIRPFHQTYGGSGLAHPFDGPSGNRLSFSMLTSIAMPTIAGEGPNEWHFDYIDNPSTTDYPNDVGEHGYPASAPTVRWDSSSVSGLLLRYTLPTKGAIQYKYGQRHFVKRYCHPELNGNKGPFGFNAVGVRERQVFLATGAADGRPWVYDGHEYDPGTGQCDFPREFIGTVVDPLGNATTSFFSVYFDGTNPGGVWKTEEFGLSISKEENDGAGRYLSSRVFRCANPALFDDPATSRDAFRKMHARWRTAGETATCGDPVRETYASWDRSTNWCETETSCTQINPRMTSTLTRYLDDGAAYASTNYSDFDGLGHFRTTVTGGNFFALTNPLLAGGDEKVTFTGYNPGVFFSNNALAFPGGAQPANVNWLFTNYDLVRVQQAPNGAAGGANPQIASTLYQFNGTTGFLERTRRLRRSVACNWDPSTNAAACFDSSAEDPADLLTESVRTSNGTATTIVERNYGGDGGQLPYGPLNTSLAQAVQGYVAQSDYRYGGLERHAWMDCGAGNPILITEQNTIDPKSGMVLTSKDSSGATTTYAYDDLGRVKTLDPPGNDAAANYAYSAAGTGPAHVTVTYGSGPILKTVSYYFDHLGRLAIESSKVPADSGMQERRQTTHYFANGWIDWKTTAGPGNGPINWSSLAGASGAKGYTTYNSYDAFGRPTTITNPDNVPGSSGTSRSDLQYFGDRVVKKQEYRLASATSDTTVTTWLAYDRWHRLNRVTEQSNNDGDAATRYTYDNLDHLTRVDSPSGQVRTFGYDMRGFLLAETHPELTATIQYQQFDSRGHARLRKLSQGSGAFDVRMSYDGAERLVSVDQDNPSRKLKEFFYYTAADNAPLTIGKPKTTIRHNWIPNPAQLDRTIDVPVSQTYFYDGTAGGSTGRMIRRRTASSGLTFPTFFGWTPLGDPASVTYPQVKCLNCPTIGSARTVTSSYTEGLLTSIGGYVDSITYNENGVASTVKHANGATDVFGNDANALPRIASSTTTFRNGTQWATGSYAYDGLGNVSAIGTASFTYDHVNRLRAATLTSGTQQYTYDVEGNIQSFNGSALNPDTATNRLPSATASYDDDGNMASWTDPRRPGVGYAYRFDSLNSMTTATGTSMGRIFLYDAADERVAILDYLSATPKIRETWSIRGAANEVLRDYTATHATTAAAKDWTWSWRDNVYRGTTIVAQVRPVANAPDQILHTHVDHLGSIRAVSDPNGLSIDRQDFFPFGEEPTAVPDENRFKFTGHERDESGRGDVIGTLDAMHARYYAPALGRFLSLDPAAPDWTQPQTLNRYTYVTNNPITLSDPTGRCFWDACVGETLAAAAAVTAVTAWAVAPNAADPSKNNLRAAGDQLTAGANTIIQAARPSAEKARKLWADWVESWHGERPDVPVDDKGRHWPMHHVKPRADGGSDTGDNLIPLPPWEHVDWHKLKGDFERWAKGKGKDAPPPPKEAPKPEEKQPEKPNQPIKR